MPEEIKEADLNDNSDMVSNDAETTATENTEQEISFKVSQPQAPQRGWSHKDKRAVWIIAVVITVLLVVVNVILSMLGLPMLGIF